MSVDVEPQREAVAAAAEEEGAASDESEVLESHIKAQRAADNEEKEQSRKAFSALVRACSQRSYPYQSTCNTFEVPCNPGYKDEVDKVVPTSSSASHA